MSPETVRWIIGILVTLFLGGVTILVTVLISILNRKNDTIEKLKEANINYRLALIQLGIPPADAVNRARSAFPIPMDGSGQ